MLDVAAALPLSLIPTNTNIGQRMLSALSCCMQFLSSQQKTTRHVQHQPTENCRSSNTCPLKNVEDEDGNSTPLFEACGMWPADDISRFGEELDSLRELYDKADDKNSFHTTRSGVRIWPYRPRKTGSARNLNLYGLKSQSSAKCDDCFDKDRINLLEDVLVRFG